MQVTESATQVLKQARTDAGVPPDAGIRLMAAPTEQAKVAIRMEFAEEPEQGDEVIEEPGIRIFVQSDLVDTLSQRVLDANDTPNGPELSLREATA